MTDPSDIAIRAERELTRLATQSPSSLRVYREERRRCVQQAIAEALKTQPVLSQCYEQVRQLRQQLADATMCPFCGGELKDVICDDCRAEREAKRV